MELAFFTESRRRSLNRNVPLTAVVIPTCGYVLPSSVCHTVVMLKLRSAEYDAVYVGVMTGLLASFQGPCSPRTGLL